MTDANEDRVWVALSLQRALLGAVTPPLRGVTCDWDDETVTVRAYYDGEIAAADAETMDVVETEVAADFPDRTVDLQTQRYDAPQPLSEKALRLWVYRRKE